MPTRPLKDAMKRAVILHRDYEVCPVIEETVLLPQHDNVVLAVASRRRFVRTVAGLSSVRWSVVG